jgi:AraC-like DNA-binding protein
MKRFSPMQPRAGDRPSMGPADGLFFLNGRSLDDDAWVDTLYDGYGLECQLDDGAKASSMVQGWSAGELSVLSTHLAWQRLSANERNTQSSEHIYLKIVRQGALLVECNGESEIITDGGIVLVDPLAGFTDRYQKSTQLTIVSIPRYLLTWQANSQFFPYPVVANGMVPDIDTVRDCLVFGLERSACASEKVRSLIAMQCLGLIEIFLESAQVISQSQPPTSAAIMFRAKQAMHRLITAQDLNVDMIASAAAIPKHTLIRALKAEGMESPMRYIWSLRLDQAARLLRSAPNIHVKEVAWQFGFASAAHFSRTFRRRFGVTPKEYAVHERESVQEAARERLFDASQQEF